jgi:hypothetical protein
LPDTAGIPSEDRLTADDAAQHGEQGTDSERCRELVPFVRIGGG